MPRQSEKPISLAAKVAAWEADADQHLVEHVRDLVAEDKATWVWDPVKDGVVGLLIPDTYIALVVIYPDGDWECDISLG